ncbi:hypothetical protein A2J03_21025 [Rhodococcus sp. EPR-157]|nr:hypothetical protein A2J03_21025 [Rhodococcus sp. EPR-157]
MIEVAQQHAEEARGVDPEAGDNLCWWPTAMPIPAMREREHLVNGHRMMGRRSSARTLRRGRHHYGMIVVHTGHPEVMLNRTMKPCVPATRPTTANISNGAPTNTQAMSEPVVTAKLSGDGLTMNPRSRQ